MDGCPFRADYTQERFIVDATRHFQNHTPLYEPADCPNYLHEGISTVAGIEASDARRRMKGNG